eukprot:g6115.t1
MLRRTLTGVVAPLVQRNSLRSFASVDEEIKASEALFRPTKFKPPLDLFGPAGRYASGCWSAAAAQKKLDVVEKQLDELAKVFSAKPEFLLYLSDPTEVRHKRIEKVKEVFKKFKVDSILSRLFEMMAENGRLNVVPKMIVNYKKLMSAHKKETVVSVVTAGPLSSNDQKQLADSLRKKIGVDRKIIMNTKVNPEILGGMILEWDDAYRMDLSVSGSIKRLEKELLNSL